MYPVCFKKISRNDSILRHSSFVIWYSAVRCLILVIETDSLIIIKLCNFGIVSYESCQVSTFENFKYPISNTKSQWPKIKTPNHYPMILFKIEIIKKAKRSLRLVGIVAPTPRRATSAIRSAEGGSIVNRHSIYWDSLFGLAESHTGP